MFGSDRTKEAAIIDAIEGAGAEDVHLYRVRHRGTAAPAGISDQNLLVVNVGAARAAYCRVGGAELNHRCEPGNVTVIPAETEWSAVLADRPEMIVVAVPKPRLALAAAQALQANARIETRLRHCDAEMLSIVGEMVESDREGDAAAWHRLADELADHLVDSYGARKANGVRGVLTPRSLARLNGYLRAHLEEPISIDALADVVHQSRSHFPRVFRRTAGMSPHQYVMRLRLRCARRLIDEGVPLAEAAVGAGFAHQSHLTNWMRRIYGTTPGSLSRRN